jgi:predicted TIM-barrel fold metal-dependent hydrolase
VPSSRVLYGSDFPWFDPAANLTRVLLADIEEEGISRILRDNAIEVYGIRD